MNVPSGYTALDLIGFTDRGNYDSTANYVKNDLVHHNNSIWKCLVDDTTAVTPAEGANWTVYIQNGTTLNGMADVNLTTPANGDLLRYNSTSSKWENQDVDSTPTQSSTKLVQSGGVYTQLAGKADTADLATVATSGAYSDLSGAPQLAAVATSGAYSDLTGQPTIPTVNDATLTIQKNGTNVETFTANSSTNKTANITVPDVINDLSDVNISSVANEEILAYDSTLSKWKNSGALGALKETFTNNGAHNLLPNLWGETRTVRDVTFTINSDGTVVVNGTVNSSYASTFIGTSRFLLPAGSYKISGCPSGGGGTQYRLAVYNVDSSSDIVYDNGVGASFTLANDTNILVNVYAYRNHGAFSNLKFYPMIRLASDTDTTYTPYAMTNKELTKSVLYFSNVACSATTGNFATVSDSSITSNHIVVDVQYTDPVVTHRDVTWTTSDGSLVLNGACYKATTATIILAKKGN